MIYTFAVNRSPHVVLPDRRPRFGHYFGGSTKGLGASVADQARFARVLTLDLSDPKLSFLRFKGHTEIPLVMDFVHGAIDYSVRKGLIELHSESLAKSESLLERKLPKHGARLEPMTYEQYRATSFARNAFGDSYLSEEDSAYLQSLGDSYTQVGGSHARGSDHRPYCGNRRCAGYGAAVTQLLATVSQSPAPKVSLDFLPYDPAIEFSFCHSCHAISGAIVPD